MKKRFQNMRKPELSKPKLMVSVFVIFCLALVVWDMSRTGLNGSLSGEVPNQGVLAGLDADADEEQDSSQGEGESLDGTAEDDANDAEGDNYYASTRMQREQVRADELALLQTIIDDDEGSPTLAEEAEQRRMEITANMEQELQAESLLAAKGYEQAVVMIGDQQAMVVVAGEIAENDATLIAELVDDISGIGYRNVVVVNK